MALLAPDIAEQTLLKYIVNKQVPDDPVLKLYKNDHDPTDNTTLSDLTEATETGYAPITLTGASWTVATVSGVTTASFAAQTFTVTVAATYYGYFVENSSGDLLWVERFSGAPFILPSGGGSVEITVKTTMD